MLSMSSLACSSLISNMLPCCSDCVHLAAEVLIQLLADLKLAHTVLQVGPHHLARS